MAQLGPAVLGPTTLGPQSLNKDFLNQQNVVKVETKVAHPFYKKFIKRSKKYAAHDEMNTCKIGDIVQIKECSPISKNKTWEIISEVS